MFCAPTLFFGSTEGVISRFNVLRVRTRFRRYRGRRVPFSYFACSDSFTAVQRASGPVFMFCARTLFRPYRVRRVPFSCFARPDSFSTVPRASGLVYMFCAPGLIFGGIEGVQSRFHVLRARTHFRRFGGRRVSFSCFARPDSFSAVRGHRVPFSSYLRPYSFSGVPSASFPVFMFSAPGLVFNGTYGVGSRFHVLRIRTLFRQYRGRRVPFSCFVRLDSFSAVSRASGLVFMFCAPELLFGCIEGVGSRFHVLRSRTRFRRC
jgi:hypothetical protein